MNEMYTPVCLCLSSFIFRSYYFNIIRLWLFMQRYYWLFSSWNTFHRFVSRCQTKQSCSASANSLDTKCGFFREVLGAIWESLHCILKQSLLEKLCIIKEETFNLCMIFHAVWILKKKWPRPQEELDCRLVMEERHQEKKKVQVHVQEKSVLGEKYQEPKKTWIPH